jgi:hypothetical protein
MMIMYLKQFPLLLVITAVFSLSGCGGSGGGSSNSGPNINTAEATVSTDNQGEIVQGSRIGLLKTVESAAAPTPFAAVNAGASNLAELLAQGAYEFFRPGNVHINAEVDYSSFCDGGGTATLVWPDQQQESGTGSFTYTECVVAGFTINGSAIFTWTNNFEQFTYVFDLTYSDGTNTYELNGAMQCTAAGCSYFEDFSSNGIDYRVSDVSVAGNNETGYDIVATVYVGDLGYITVTAEDIVICDSGNIESGTVYVTDSSDAVVIQIDFPGDCATMTVTYDGVGTTVAQ